MGLPTSMTASPKRSITGIRLGIAPSTFNPPFEVELQRSTQSSTSSTAWASDVLAPAPADYAYVVELPLSTRTFYFRARHVGTGYSVGSFTATVHAMPVKLTGTFTPIRMVRNNKGNVEVLGGNIWLSSARTVKVGTEQTTSFITKVLHIGSAGFTGGSTADKWAFGRGGLNSATTATLNIHWPVILPAGAIITKVQCRMYRATTADAASFIFTSSTGSTAGSILTTGKHTATSYQTVTGTTFSHTVLNTLLYNLAVTLNPGVLAKNARIVYSDITYKMGSYEKAY